MCGISAYIGSRQCRSLVLEGLTRLEYRGYDSAGIVCIDTSDGFFKWSKSVGDLNQLKQSLATTVFDGTVGMGHTRWATHGGINEPNAHPHFDCSKKLALVHNGIIENYEELKASLSHKHHFTSTTDSEVFVHLLEEEREKHASFGEALCALGKRLQGAYALIIMNEDEPDTLYVLRNRVPLVIGKGIDEVFIASDYLAFSDKHVSLFFPPHETYVTISAQSLACFDFNNSPLSIDLKNPTISHALSYDKDGYEHYMLKEIYEQEKSIVRTINYYADRKNSFYEIIGISKERLTSFKKIVCVAAGTSYHAAATARFYFETVTQIPTSVELASEFCYSPFFPSSEVLYIFISQSGETLDTLEALRIVGTHSGTTLALTNVETSSLAREAEGLLLMHAGPEFSVASTKSFTTQLSLLYWFAHRLAEITSNNNRELLIKAEEQLYATAHSLQVSLNSFDSLLQKSIVPKYSSYDRFIFLGRHVQYWFAAEAALKLKELSYVFAQAYPAGELKHGPMALIDETVPVVLFSIKDRLMYRKLVSNAHEIKARKGRLLVFAFAEDKELLELADDALIFPHCDFLLEPLLMAGVMQLFVYHFTHARNLPIDKPRNLAKSVTVE